jgi:hypothetical protein
MLKTVKVLLKKLVQNIGIWGQNKIINGPAYLTLELLWLILKFQWFFQKKLVQSAQNMGKTQNKSSSSCSSQKPMLFITNDSTYLTLQQLLLTLKKFYLFFKEKLSKYRKNIK